MSLNKFLKKFILPRKLSSQFVTLLGPLCPCQAYESIEHVLVVIMAKYHVNRSTRSVIILVRLGLRRASNFSRPGPPFCPDKNNFCELYALIFNLIKPPTEGPSILGDSVHPKGPIGIENAGPPIQWAWPSGSLDWPVHIGQAHF